MDIPTIGGNASSPPELGDQAVVGAARYGAVPALMEGLLHDVRNPLNALAIHLEVLSEKLKAETGQVPAAQDRSLRAMREQIHRVDGVLRQFADFIVFRGGRAGEVELSTLVTRALEVLAHEARRRRLRVDLSLEPGAHVRLPDTGDLGLLLVQVLLRAFSRSRMEGSVRVRVIQEETQILLAVEDGGGGVLEPSPGAVAALQVRCQQLGVRLELEAGGCWLRFPRA